MAQWYVPEGISEVQHKPFYKFGFGTKGLRIARLVIPWSEHHVDSVLDDITHKWKDDALYAPTTVGDTRPAAIENDTPFNFVEAYFGDEAKLR